MTRAARAGVLLAALAGCRAAAPADLVLRGGVIYPFAVDSAPAEALAVRDGMVVYVGGDGGATALIGRATRVIDLGGRVVLPGLHDTHVHPRGGIAMTEIVLNDLQDRQAILDTVRSWAARHPERSWVRGRGWQLPVFPGANPRREWLDLAVPDRPVYLVAADGHSAWVNSRALDLAGVTRDTPDPPAGRIERDPSGQPSGTLRESAMELVERHLPPRTPEETVAGLLRALAMANRYGITSLHDGAAGPALLAGYATLDREGRLTARVTAALQTDPAAGPAQVESLRVWRGRYAGTRYFRPAAAKIFADGVMEPRTAWLLEPYLRAGGSRGLPNLLPGAMDTLVTALDAAGFQVHVHAIGDAAVRMALDAFAAARRANGPRDARPIVTHLELIDSTDIPRFAALGVVASVQALWAYADPYITEMTEPFLGPARSRWLYPIGALARSGAIVAGASDWSVSSMNPFEAIQVALTRRGPSDTLAGPAWNPAQVVDLNTMLRAYTTAGAHASFTEAVTGTLEPGKAADLVVLDRDPHRSLPTRLHQVRVLLTLLEGREVWRDSTFR